MKRIVTVQDISCLGKCSLTCALPVISAMGVEASIIPTAVLSTHTMFKNVAFRDLTEDIPDILSHWKREGFTFDAVYTGYLGSLRQIELVEGLIRDFSLTSEGKKTAVIVDPAMGDSGKLYTGFTQEFADVMAGLCGKADYILPNLTEVSFMLHEPYQAAGDRAFIHEELKKLAELGARCPVITGVSYSGREIGAAAYDRETGEFSEYLTEKVPQMFHGTGDLFASVFTGALVRGRSLGKALQIAADFTRKAVEVTMAEPDHITYATCFEYAIPYLLELMREP